MSELRLVHSGEPMPGTVRPRRRNVNVRMLHPSLPVWDESSDPTPDMVRFALSAVIAHARRTGGDQIVLAADVVEAAMTRKAGA